MMWTVFVALVLIASHQAAACGGTRKVVRSYLHKKINKELQLDDGKTNTVKGWHVSLHHGKAHGVNDLSVVRITQNNNEEFSFVMTFNRLACEYKYSLLKSGSPSDSGAWWSVCDQIWVFVSLYRTEECKVSKIEVEYQVLKGCGNNVNKDRLTNEMREEVDKTIRTKIRSAVKKELEIVLDRFFINNKEFPC